MLEPETQGKPLAFTNIKVDTSLSSGIAAFEIAFQTADHGFIEAAGSLNLPAHEQGWLETIIADTTIKISSLELQEYLEVGAALLGLPGGEGTLNADLHIKTVGIDDLEINGLAELTGVALVGGFLGEDRPTFRKVRLSVNEGRWMSSGWSMKGFVIASDTLDLEASAEFFPEKTLLTAEGVLDLPVLFDQAPRLLGVHEETFLEEGLLEFTVDLADTGRDKSVKLKARTDSIGGIFQDSDFSWDTPVTLYINGEKKGGGIHVGALQLDAPFARLKGSGDLHSFALDAEVDLEKWFTDIGRLFQLVHSVAGTAELTLKSIRPEAESGRFEIDGEFSISDFALGTRDEQVVPVHDLSLIGGFRAPDTFFDRYTGEVDLQVALSSWFGEVFLVLNGEKHGEKPFKGFYTTDAELDLSQLAALLKAVKVSNTDAARIGGTVQLQAAGFAGKSVVDIRDLAAEITGFGLEYFGTVVSEPLVTVDIEQPVNDEVPFLSVRKLQVVENRQSFFSGGAGANVIDISSGNIFLQNVEVQSASGEGTVDRLAVSYGRNGLHAELSGRLGGGTVDLVAEAKNDNGQWIVKTPASSKVMSGVTLSGKLAKVFFAKVHPFFGSLASMAGPLDVRLDSLWWPVGEQESNEKRLVVIFGVSEMDLEAGKPLREILAACGLEKETLQLRDDEIYCIGQGGRIKCSPVRMLAGDAELVAGGSIAMDSSLEYRIEVPVTVALVGEKTSKHLGPAKVDVAVEGTVDAPSFDRKKLASEIKRLVEKAGGKGAAEQQDEGPKPADEG